MEVTINMNSYDYFGYEPDVAATNQIQAQIQANLKKEQEQHQAEINAVIQVDLHKVSYLKNIRNLWKPHILLD